MAQRFRQLLSSPLINSAGRGRQLPPGVPQRQDVPYDLPSQRGLNPKTQERGRQQKIRAERWLGT